MASSRDSSNPSLGDPPLASKEADLVKISEAWAQISQGEKTAHMLESNLTNLEKKINALLASFEEPERTMQPSGMLRDEENAEEATPSETGAPDAEPRK